MQPLAAPAELSLEVTNLIEERTGAVAAPPKKPRAASARGKARGKASPRHKAHKLLVPKKLDCGGVELPYINGALNKGC